MLSIVQTAEYRAGFEKLRDVRARQRILVRLRRLSIGHFGDTKSVGDGVSELRIDYGPGYRVYFVRRGALMILLLCGGDKGSQSRDIARAKTLARTLME
jgi:putative addiction module killer protein